MSFLEVVRRANAPGPPEHSIPFRAATAATVVVAIAACYDQHEMTAPVAAVSMGAIALGNVISYRRRNRSGMWLKALLAVAVVAGFVSFFHTVTDAVSSGGFAGNIGAVQGPLAILFTWIQVTHAFDLPSRKDLGFSLAGSATLMAVAAVQAIDLTFAVFVLVWVAFVLWSLVSMWHSVVGLPARTEPELLRPALSVFAVALVVVLLLPAPRVSKTVVFPSSLANDIPLPSSSTLAGGGRAGTEPARAAPTSGPTRVGGYLGFAGPLDTALRGSLGNEVVMRVRASEPTFWVSETFDHWDGQSWTESESFTGPHAHALTSGPPFTIPPEPDDTSVGAGSTDIQTFYLATPEPNLIFHADQAVAVYLPARTMTTSDDDALLSGVSLGAGTIYTVVSQVDTPSPTELDHAASTGVGSGDIPSLDATDTARYTETPYDPAVAALARSITASAPTTYAKVMALEVWMQDHVHYSLQIPPLQPGQNAVNEFLFGSRTGYCEQISTAMTVMLRSLGIPARETVGYVPGSFDPITDLYEVQAKDAHAWTQVWFPGYGWQSFDPTAVVPDANPTPASALAHDVGDALRRIPAVPVTLVLLAAIGTGVLVTRRRRRPRSWAGRLAAGLDRAGRRAGIRRRPEHTVLEHAGELARHARAGGADESARAIEEIALLVDRCAYGLGTPTDEEARRHLAALRRIRLPSSRRSARERVASGRP